MASMLNLAQTLYAQGDLAEVRTLQEQVLEARARLLGKEHPDTLTSMLNLAQTLYAQGDAKADSLHRQVLRILAEFSQRTGHEHPHFRIGANGAGRRANRLFPVRAAFGTRLFWGLVYYLSKDYLLESGTKVLVSMVSAIAW
jgi:hypothetical protein